MANEKENMKEREADREITLTKAQQDVLDRLEWGLCEDCRNKVMSNPTLLRQLLNGEVTDFVGHAPYEVDAETGERFAVHSYEYGGLQIRYRPEGPIKIRFRPKRATPWLRTEFGKDIMTPERVRVLTDSFPVAVKDEEGKPVLDRDGNPKEVPEYKNLNLGEVVYIENAAGEKTGYLVSLDFPEYGAKGFQYRGTNELITKPVSVVKSQLQKFFANGDFRGHKFTEGELQMLTVGKPLLLTDLKRKDGSTYSMSVQYNVAKNRLDTVRNNEYFKARSAAENIKRYFGDDHKEQVQQVQEAPKAEKPAKAKKARRG